MRAGVLNSSGSLTSNPAGGGCASERRDALVRRIFLLAAVAAMMLALTAGPAFAAASPDANCWGRTASELNEVGKELLDEGGFGGEIVSGVTKDLGGVGE